jgi:hypothetical protein
MFPSSTRPNSSCSLQSSISSRIPTSTPRLDQGPPGDSYSSARPGPASLLPRRLWLSTRAATGRNPRIDRCFSVWQPLYLIPSRLRRDGRGAEELRVPIHFSFPSSTPFPPSTDGRVWVESEDLVHARGGGGSDGLPCRSNQAIQATIEFKFEFPS